jgi:predicted enzyme involved in methoxymalonyl-ACP biosynthesis
MSKKRDLNLISRALSYIYDGSMDNIFRIKEILKNISVVSFDNDYIYLFTFENNIVNIDEIAHSEDILDKTKRGWSAYLRQKEELRKYIPDKYLKIKFYQEDCFLIFRNYKDLVMSYILQKKHMSPQ